VNYATLSKRCKRCQDMKTVDHFGTHAKTKDGYQTICNECHRIASTKAMAKKVKVARVKEGKVCHCCKSLQPYHNYYKNVATSDKLMYICKDCFGKKYRKKSTPVNNNTPLPDVKTIKPSIVTPTVKATGFTVKDGFAIKNEVKKEPTRIEEMVTDATLAHLVGTFIRTGITLFKYIMKEMK